LEASFLEIYNEEIRDLLATEKGLKYEIKMATKENKDDANGGVYVSNLHVEEVRTPEQISALLRRARKSTQKKESQSCDRGVILISAFVALQCGLWPPPI
jgi:kinesin family protein C1